VRSSDAHFSLSLRDRYLDLLTRDYRVVIMDYPPTGDDAAAVIDSFTPDRVSRDILAVADAVGAEHFAWYGYSWGGVVGLQLAAKEERLTAPVGPNTLLFQASRARVWPSPAATM
jgi:pimeloyl-ACP methyl ester carboxylesterase